MIFDLIILLIILLFGFLGLRNGFVYSIFRFLGWIAAVIAAIFLQSYVVNLIKEYTLFYDNYANHISSVCHGFIDRYTGGVQGNVPGAFGESLEDATTDVIDSAAANIADASFSVIVFIILVFLIKFILFLFTVLFSKKYHEGFVGGVDGIAGCVLGVIQGVIIVLVLLALLMPVSFAVSPNFYETVNETMKNSLLTELLYKNNPFLNLVNGFIPEEFLPSNWADPEPVQDVDKDWDNLV